MARNRVLKFLHAGVHIILPARTLYALSSSVWHMANSNLSALRSRNTLTRTVSTHADSNTHTHTHTHIYIYIYIYICTLMSKYRPTRLWLLRRWNIWTSANYISGLFFEWIESTLPNGPELEWSFDWIAQPTWAELNRSKPSWVRIRLAESTQSAQKNSLICNVNQSTAEQEMFEYGTTFQAYKHCVAAQYTKANHCWPHSHTVILLMLIDLIRATYDRAYYLT